MLKVVSRSPYTCPEVDVSCCYTTEVSCLEVSVELAVHVYLSASACTVDSYSNVVPVVVGKASVACYTHSIVMEYQSALLQVKCEEIERTAHFLTITTSVRDNGSSLLCIVSLKPCLDGVVHSVIYYT